MILPNDLKLVATGASRLGDAILARETGRPVFGIDQLSRRMNHQLGFDGGSYRLYDADINSSEPSTFLSVQP